LQQGRETDFSYSPKQRKLIGTGVHGLNHAQHLRQFRRRISRCIIWNSDVFSSDVRGMNSDITFSLIQLK
jgi:hypothetical protein